MAHPLHPSSAPPQDQAAVEHAEKQVGAVLEHLESQTGAEVRGIGLDDIVDTDPQTGRPVVKKAVDIRLARRAPRIWSR